MAGAAAGGTRMAWLVMNIAATRTATTSSLERIGGSSPVGGFGGRRGNYPELALLSNSLVSAVSLESADSSDHAASSGSAASLGSARSSIAIGRPKGAPSGGAHWGVRPSGGGHARGGGDPEPGASRLSGPAVALRRRRWPMAARMGFEPMDALRHQRFSRPPPSSTLAPCRWGV